MPAHKRTARNVAAAQSLCAGHSSHAGAPHRASPHPRSAERAGTAHPRPSHASHAGAPHRATTHVHWRSHAHATPHVHPTPAHVHAAHVSAAEMPSAAAKVTAATAMATAATMTATATMCQCVSWSADDNRSDQRHADGQYFSGHYQASLSTAVEYAHTQSHTIIPIICRGNAMLSDLSPTTGCARCHSSLADSSPAGNRPCSRTHCTALRVNSVEFLSFNFCLMCSR